MKTVNNLFEKIIDVENIIEAIHRAAKGKKHKKNVQHILDNDRKAAEKLSYLLKTNQWHPALIHKVKSINDGVGLKKREIVCPQFLNELVVQHAVIKVCQPYFMKKIYRYSCAAIPGRGVEFTIKHIRKAVRDYKNTKYFTTLDIRGFFNNARPSKVFRQLRRIIRDKKVLRLFALMLRANKVDSPTDGTIKRGMPIGFYNSQWFANILLTPLDHYVKSFGIKHYFRYNDDLLLFCSNKRKLKKVIIAIKEYLNKISLKLKNPPQIHRFSKVKIRYIGAIISPEKIILQEKVFLKACRSARRISRKGKITVYDARKMLSYAARFSHFDAHKAYIEKINSKVPKAKCRKIVSRHERRKNRCGINQVQP